jgi:copper chaperone CopZ
MHIIFAKTQNSLDKKHQLIDQTKEFKMNRTDTLKITGMSCQMCVKHVTKALQGITGVTDVVVQLESGTATVTYDSQLAGWDDFRAAVAEAGYAVVS